MELREDDFHELKLRVDKVASELDKQKALKAVNTKWMIIVGALILAALGYTSFIQIPKEAIKAAQEQVGEDTIKAANEIIGSLRENKGQAEEILEGVKLDVLVLKGKKGASGDKPLEEDEADKVLFFNDGCIEGVIISAKNDGQPAICTCQTTKWGKGWVCFN